MPRGTSTGGGGTSGGGGGGGGTSGGGGSGATSTSGGASSAETEPETQTAIYKRITEDSRPFSQLTTHMVDVIKRVTAKKVFPYSKFLMKEEEVNGGYVQLVFVEMNWHGKGQKWVNARARNWKMVGQEVMRRCADRRARVLSEFTKACKGRYSRGQSTLSVIVVLTPSCTFMHSRVSYTDFVVKSPAPTAEKILEIYKQVFGSGRKSDLRAVSEQDTRYLVWFCSSVAAIISVKETKGRPKNKNMSYSARTTPSDEAFAFMILEHHKEKWDPAAAACEQPRKKRRVSGAGNSVATTVLKELDEFRTKN